MIQIGKWMTLGVSLLAVTSAQAAAPMAGPVKVEQQSTSADWKGKPDDSEFSLGALAGLGILDGTGGFDLLATGSQTILRQGFIPDIANPVSIEAQFGPLFISGATAAVYSAHLRWNFQKDDSWTFYALGGLGGAFRSNLFELYPRFGVGVLWQITQVAQLRAEVSHELMGVGFVIPLWR